MNRMMSMSSAYNSALRATIGVTALLMGVGVFAVGRAQDTPVTTHPANLFAGTCAELTGNPIDSLRDLAPRTYDIDEGEFRDERPESRGSLAAPEVLDSQTTLDVEFDDLLGTAHAIVVAASLSELQTVIACGDIGGPIVDDTVNVALIEQNDSGYFGLAMVSKDDDQTEFTLYLGQIIVDQVAPEQPTPENETEDDAATPSA